MININGIEILDSWDGSRDNVTVCIGPPQKAFASFPILTENQLPPVVVSVGVFCKDKLISAPCSFMVAEDLLEEKITEKVESLKKVFGENLIINK